MALNQKKQHHTDKLMGFTIILQQKTEWPVISINGASWVDENHIRRCWQCQLDTWKSFCWNENSLINGAFKYTWNVSIFDTFNSFFNIISCSCFFLLRRNFFYIWNFDAWRRTCSPKKSRCQCLDSFIWNVKNNKKKLYIFHLKYQLESIGQRSQMQSRKKMELSGKLYIVTR